MPKTAYSYTRAPAEDQASALGEEDPGAAYDCLLATVPGFREGLDATPLRSAWRVIWPGLAVAVGGLLLLRLAGPSQGRQGSR